MTDEIIPVPDDLVQNWPTETQDQLLAVINTLLEQSGFLTDCQPVVCSEIGICGSRVHGGYKQSSDMDAVAYINNYTPPTIPGRLYFRHREITTFQNVKVDVWLKSSDDKGIGTFPKHPDAPSELGWRLPYYSLITHTLEQVYPDEIEGYLNFMYPMKPSMSSAERRWDKLIVPINLPF